MGNSVDQEKRKNDKELEASKSNGEPQVRERETMSRQTKIVVFSGFSFQNKLEEMKKQLKMPIAKVIKTRVVRYRCSEDEVALSKEKIPN